MTIRSTRTWFLAFTGIFAVLAGFVFWGTWSPDFAPVMPDNPTTHSPWWISDWFDGWRQTGKFVPGDLIVFLGSPYLWQELKYALSLYCAALGMAWFLRGRGLSHLASCGAGLFLGFSGYWCSLFSAGHYGWFQWMAYGVFAFGLIDRAVCHGKVHHWLLLGACLAWASFNQPDLWLLFTLLTAAYFVFRCCCAKVWSQGRFWKGLGLAAVSFFIIGAPSFRQAICHDLGERDKQISEGQTVAKDAAGDDAEARWIFATNWSLPTDETAEFFIPRLNGDTSCPLTLSIGLQHGSGIKPYTGALGRPKDAPQGNYRQHSLYVGWVTCLLALCGVVLVLARRREGRAEVLFFAVAAVVFWLFSQGRYCEPVYRLVYALPFGDYLRAPVKWHHLTEFCLVVLAGFGVEALLGFCKTPALKGVLAALVLYGAVDLARVNHLYCAPVDLREARRTASGMQMTILRKSDFQNPQVAEMVRQGRVVSLANYLGNPEVYVVEALDKYRKPTTSPATNGMAVALGLLSIFGSLVIVLFAVIAARKRRMVLAA